MENTGPLFHGENIVAYQVEKVPPGWHMRRIFANTIYWIEIIDWVLSNGFASQIIHEEDYGLPEPLFLIWTNRKYEQTRESNVATTRGGTGFVSSFAFNLYMSDEAEIHFKMKFD